ncbi:MAG TPA: SusC/RagA family TonB-linked outer membrane protein [Petrimonas sp.]|uniref:SusC/RagA family TonB-linked outer membrane protein n=1 Tax=Petrimonas sp. TaxID=2023866 RepID=UPI00175724D8|nr:SusC/RagA family TonB-linked outer membrane protein [Petrimonas sp.]
MKLSDSIKKRSNNYLKGVFLFLFLFSVSTAIQAQNQKITISQKQTTILSVFEEIEKQTNMKIAYNEKAIDVNKSISIDVTKKTLPETLSAVLKGTNMTFKIQGKQIMIVPIMTANSDENIARKYSGTVIDENGLSIIGANIVQKGTTNGTITDTEGKFSLSVPIGSILTVSYIGYITQEIKVDNHTNLQITLVEDAKSLSEVVVVGYGIMNRKNVTTAISTVKPENISKAAVSNVSQMLMGRAAGLTANLQSPQPGGDVSLSIRGSGTPVFVIDGVMMPSGSLEVGTGHTEMMQSIRRGGLAGLNPSDIESIEILKDASAAIYGIGAANGVVLITTKNGSEGKLNITFESNWSAVKNYPYLKPLNSQDYMNMANVFNKENYLLVNNMYPYGPNTYDNKWTPSFYPHQIEAAQTTNWLDYVIKNGSISNQNISISGGNKTFKYYLSGNYYNHNGTVINSGMERLALRTNISAQLFPFLRLTTIVNLNQNNYTNSSAEGGNTWSDVLVGSLQNALAYPPLLPIKGNDGKYTIFQNRSNPADMARMNDRTQTDGYYVNFAADVDIIKDMLSARLMYGSNKENGNRDFYLPSDFYFFSMYKSRGHLGYTERRNETVETTVSFKKQFGKWAKVDVVAGMGRYLNKGQSLDVDYENANDVIAGDNVSTANGPFYPESGRYANERRSQFVRASVDLLDNYVITSTLRRDGTDKFFPDKKYALFPSVSIAWKLSNESFMKNFKWLEMFKLRASYGQTGLDNLGSSMYSTYTRADQYVKFSENTVTYIPFRLNGPDYPNITWEKTIMKDIGVDFALFNNRVWGSFDWFRNDVTDLLRNSNAPLLSMTPTIPMNYGHYYRRGWDATLNSINIENKGEFSWRSLLTLSHYNAFWIEREPEYYYQEYQIRNNEPMSAYYSYQQDGIINIDKSNMPESQRSLPAEAQQPGFPIIKDKNNDGQITVDDVYMENIIPDITIGLGNTFSYKNFDLDIFLYGQFGQMRSNYALNWASAGQLYMDNPRNNTDLSFNLWNSQTNPNGTLPGIAILKTVPMPGNAGINYIVQDASFVRIRDITFGYNIMGNSLGNFGRYIRNIRLFVNVQNPFTFTKFTGFDPEIYQGNGTSMAEHPMTRTFSTGAKINF